MGLSRIFHGVCRILEGLHIDLHPTHHDTPFAGLREDEDGTSTVATLSTLSWLRRTARQSGKAGRQGGPGGVAGMLGWQAGWGHWPGQMAGREGGGRKIASLCRIKLSSSR